MEFATPLLRGALVRRYKRFLADVVLDDGETVTAHCPNSGSMLSVQEPGSEVWLSHSDKPGRKHAHTWELIRVGDTLVGINTQHPNRVVAEAVEGGAVAELSGYERVRREVRMGDNSRVDLVLESASQPPCYVEVKNVTLARDDEKPGFVEFPDAKTARGTKHLQELTRVVAEGGRAMMFFCAQRGDAKNLAVARDIDPKYEEAFRAARAGGVEAVCYRCDVTRLGIAIADAIPIFDS
jgi:sugar fermentation stimulation protein A